MFCPIHGGQLRLHYRPPLHKQLSHCLFYLASRKHGSNDGFALSFPMDKLPCRIALPLQPRTQTRHEESNPAAVGDGFCSVEVHLCCAVAAWLTRLHQQTIIRLCIIVGTDLPQAVPPRSAETKLLREAHKIPVFGFLPAKQDRRCLKSHDNCLVLRNFRHGTFP